MGRMINFPGKKSKKQPSNTPQLPPQTTEREPNTPFQEFRDDLVIVPFSEIASRLLISLGAEIDRKIHHTNGNDFILVSLSRNIYPEQTRNPRTREFEGDLIAPFAMRLYSADHRLLLHATGFHGEYSVSIGSSWSDLANEINNAGGSVVLPDAIVFLDSYPQHNTGLNDLIEKIASGCSTMGMFDVRSRAAADFARHKGLFNSPRTERDNAFNEFIQLVTDASTYLGSERTRIARNMGLLPALDVSSASAVHPAFDITL